jgi:hypothetical protein
MTKPKKRGLYANINARKRKKVILDQNLNQQLVKKLMLI